MMMMMKTIQKMMASRSLALSASILLLLIGKVRGEFEYITKKNSSIRIEELPDKDDASTSIYKYIFVKQCQTVDDKYHLFPSADYEGNGKVLVFNKNKSNKWVVNYRTTEGKWHHCEAGNSKDEARGTTWKPYNSDAAYMTNQQLEKIVQQNLGEPPKTPEPITPTMQLSHLQSLLGRFRENGVIRIMGPNGQTERFELNQRESDGDMYVWKMVSGQSTKTLTASFTFVERKNTDAELEEHEAIIWNYDDKQSTKTHKAEICLSDEVEPEMRPQAKDKWIEIPRTTMPYSLRRRLNSCETVLTRLL